MTCHSSAVGTGRHIPKEPPWPRHYPIMTNRCGTLIPSLARSLTHVCDGAGVFNEVPHSFSRSVASDMPSLDWQSNVLALHSVVHPRMTSGVPTGFAHCKPCTSRHTTAGEAAPGSRDYDNRLNSGWQVHPHFAAYGYLSGMCRLSTSPHLPRPLWWLPRMPKYVAGCNVTPDNVPFTVPVACEGMAERLTQPHRLHLPTTPNAHVSAHCSSI